MRFPLGLLLAVAAVSCGCAEEDPQESHNLIEEPEHASLVARLRRRLDELIEETGLAKDEMPLDQGIQSELPDKAIR